MCEYKFNRLRNVIFKKNALSRVNCINTKLILKAPPIIVLVGFTIGN